MTMNLSPSTTSSVPALPVLVAGAAAQLLGVASLLLLPPLAWLVAILLTAGAARYVTRGRSGVAVARAGLAVGAVSALVGLLIGGLGIVAVLLAGITVVAGVAGAVARRSTARPQL